MTVQVRAKAFMKQMSAYVADFATVELFGGERSRLQNRLALDFVLPALWIPNQEYGLVLTCRINYEKEPGHWVINTVKVSGSYSTEHILAGGSEWESIGQLIIYPLVATLRNKKEELGSNSCFAFLENGDHRGLTIDMQRIWIK